MHDRQEDAFGNQYLPTENFKGFGGNRATFVADMMATGRHYEVVILSHIHLLTVGYFIKKLSPSVKLVLLAHGIEVWKPFNNRKRQMLRAADTVLCVSNFTRQKIIDLHGVQPGRCIVLNNCLDPFLPLPLPGKKSALLSARYGLQPGDSILFTLTRLSFAEQYKGYDQVIRAMHLLQAKMPHLKYLLAGKYDPEEKTRIDALVQSAGLQQNVIRPGFISDDELPAHFALCDLFIMPSSGEGFGIAFIEALYYGLPVIAGNADGSPDALLNGRLGQLVDPGNVPGIAQAIQHILQNPDAATPDRELLLLHFSYEVYKRRLARAMTENREPVLA